MANFKTDVKQDDQNKQTVSAWPRGKFENENRVEYPADSVRKDFIGSLEQAIHKLSDSASHSDNILLPHTKLIGIPTVEGIDFLYSYEIIRCEGLQKCTRIVSTRGGALVSAYNIGEFKKLLEEYGFFSCHKSHLINLMHVKKLTREGFVYLSDNGAVPLARRKRLDFLALLKHL